MTPAALAHLRALAAAAAQQLPDPDAIKAELQAHAPDGVTIRVQRGRGGRLRIFAVEGGERVGLYNEPSPREPGRPPQPGAANELLSERITAAQRDAIEALAQREGVTKGELVRAWAGEVERGEWMPKARRTRR